ncbi:hypothetical protein ACIQK6_13675 [Streptomyces sp. NPDC091682]|uniref:hypothetical protein n=1 Tax=Streptomyces sp. NPDC091682 TaxID=3366005 RepID=UPI0038070099
MHQHPARHAEPAPAYTVQAPAAAPLVHQPRPCAAEVLLPAPAAERRALVQLDDGSWVAAYVPAAPPVIVPAAPEAAPARRGLTPFERTAVTLVGSICALTLCTGGALAMAGPAALAAAAELAIGAAALLGTAAVGWVVLRFTGALSRASGEQAAAAPAPAPVTVNVTGTGGQGGRWGSRSGTGVHIDRINISQR